MLYSSILHNTVLSQLSHIFSFLSQYKKYYVSFECVNPERSKSLSIKERIQLASAVQKQSSIQTQNMSSTEKNTASIQKYSEKETPKKSQFNQRHEDSNTYLNWLMEIRKKRQNKGKTWVKKNL
ncbi:MAG: hypothetical protein NZ516_08930 [Raineya sp.]|nr:hypothetical protein [Raineya sp.]